MRHAVPFACLAAALALATGACQRSDAPAAVAAAPVPAPDAPQAAPYGAGDAAAKIGDDAVATFLAARYGSGAKLAGDWTGIPSDAAFAVEKETADGVTRSVCAREDANIGGRPAVLLAVCGTPRDFGHPTPGITDFFLLQDQGGALAASAQAHLQEFGSMGNAGEIDVERFGAELYGFEVESGFFNMGEGMDTRTLLLPKGDTFVEAATMRAGMSYGERVEDCDERGDCPADGFDLDFDLDVDQSDPRAAAYPMVVRESGIACRKPVQVEYRLALDPATMTYAVPAQLKRETGCAAAQ